jgi:hypothetical protein
MDAALCSLSGFMAASVFRSQVSVQHTFKTEFPASHVLVCIFKNRFAVSAPEARKPVAHGETVGLAVEKLKPRQGRQKTGR